MSNEVEVEVATISPSSTSAKPNLDRNMSSTVGPTISYHQLRYTVQVKNTPCSRTTDKLILKGIDGIFHPGMNAIMGPTGCGKTSLLDVLAGRTETKGVEGHILIDGMSPPKNFKCMTGYVVQDDVVMGTLSVRENLMFSANLRISKSVGHKEKCKRVDDTIQELGLTACADTKVGTEFIRGVSGGERKRCNIGMELIIKPAILFLDEPTTGLDASTANAVLNILHSLSRRNRTIIFSIHQPRYSIFKLFDRLTLLAAGRTIYHGEAADAIGYFSSIGYECEAYNNPPDFFLDVINGDSTAVQMMYNDSEAVPELNKAAFRKLSDSAGENGNSVTLHTVENGKGCQTLVERLSDKFKSSSSDTILQEELFEIMARMKDQKNDPNARKILAKYSTSFPTQLKHVSVRMLKNLIRNPAASVLQLFVAVLMSIIIGVLYFDQGFEYPAGVQNRTGALFFIIQNQIFSNMSAVELFIKERVIFIHEMASGFYRESSYFSAKILCDFLPMRLFPLCIYVLVTYFMIGFQLEVGKFFIYFLTLFLTTMCGTAICFAVSASVRAFAVANLICILIFILMMIFGGLLVNIASLPEWLRWLQYLSIFRYALNMLSINEMRGLTFYGQTSFGNFTANLTVTGEAYLTQQGIDYGTEWEIWRNIMALGVIAVGVMVLAYIQLRRIKKLK